MSVSIAPLLELNTPGVLSAPKAPAIHGAGTTSATIKGKAPRMPAPDPVDHPPHYTSHPSGVECIEITEHMGFNLGNAVKYIWRADLKADAIEDLRKARWYVDRELKRRGHTDA